MLDRDFRKILDILHSYFIEVMNIKNSEDVIVALAKVSDEIVLADRFSLWMIDEIHDELYTVVSEGLNEIRIPKGFGIVGEAIKNSEIIISNDVQNDERFHSGIDERSGYLTKKMVVVPIKDHLGYTIGAVQVLNKIDGSDFDESDIKLLQIVVQHSFSILNSINLEKKLKIIFDYAAKVANEKERDNLLPLLADMGRDLLDAHRATLWLYDEINNNLWTKVAHGLDKISIPINRGLVGDAFIKNETLICNNPYSDPRFNQDVDKKSGYKTKSIIASPIRTSEGAKIGVIQCINKLTDDSNFSQNDYEKIRLIELYTANTLEVSALQKEIEDTQKEIIFTMGSAGEFRSKETGNHVKRVAEYSKILAKHYGLSSDEVELIKLASPMHDIGKIAIPDEILKKPAKLTIEEFEIMKTHAIMGYEILKSSKRKILKASAIIAYQHHEKWNGKGYPQGLSGEDIHIYGRISAVADVFDALGSDRCYKKAWELDRILALFKEERGNHFDPKLIDIFFENLDEFLEVRDSLRDDFLD